MKVFEFEEPSSWVEMTHSVFTSMKITHFLVTGEGGILT